MTWTIERLTNSVRAVRMAADLEQISVESIRLYPYQWADLEFETRDKNHEHHLAMRKRKFRLFGIDIL